VSFTFEDRCKKIRQDVLGIVRSSRRGHIPSALSIVEILVTLYYDILRLKNDDPFWRERDRFILSKGHGCMSLYAVLSDKGFFPKDMLDSFCSFDSRLGGHPTKEKIPGVEASTGSLGHGLSIGVGFALNARLEKSDYRTFVLLGDGECNEGSVWEAAMAASHHRLGNLVVLVDYNKNQSFDTTYKVCDLEPFVNKWKAFGFNVMEADMVREPFGLKDLIHSIPFSEKTPTAIICHTIKGKGISFMENNLTWHHKSNISEADLERIVSALED
jgi:transketolase